MGNDFWLVVRFWGTLFLIGAIAYPMTGLIFKNWWDKGYLFSKSAGLLIISYLVWLGASLHFIPFTAASIIISGIAVLAAGVGLQIISRDNSAPVKLSLGVRIFKSISFKKIVIIFSEELFFFAALLLWSYVKGHEASIHGLEKFMDFGFAKSILDSAYFPPPDMWYAGFTINYYYFGHFIMALLSKFSAIDLRYVFNLTLASLFAFTFTMSFSIGFELISKIKYQISNLHFKNQIHNSKIKMLVFSVIGGLVTAYLVTMAGNMQTIYAYTRGYTGENVKPFWELFWGINELPARLEEGMNTYWYANATRFIPYTIHEFPSYSFVVSDVHGHVMSLPFVLLAIALLINFYGGIRNNPVISGKNSDNPDQDLNHSDSLSWADSVFFGILLAVLFMTNVLDAPIYGMLFLILGFLLLSPNIFHFKDWFFKHATNVAFVAFAGPAIIPFILKFKSFVTGLAVDCPPKFLENHKIGPFLFETVDKCQKSPLWMMWLLWGFFIFCGAWLIITKLQYQKLNIKFKDVRINLSGRISQILKQYSFHFSQTELVLLVFFLYSISLIIFPEFFYFKDIYPQHFRSNTMFKLGYQAFILFSIVSGYAIVRTMLDFTNRYRLMTENFPVNRKSLNYLLFFVLLLPQLFLVCIYPSFSVKSYFGKLGNYKTLDGLSWLMNQYPDDYAVINWFNEKLAGCGLKSVSCTAPVIVEADSDSYTDYARFSAFTGAPTVVGWAVHEWLWRGTYDIVAPRRDDVAQIYESPDVGMTEKILARYDVSYIFVGTLEREKYKNLNEEKIARIASVVFSAGDSKLYRVNNLTFNGL